MKTNVPSSIYTDRDQPIITFIYTRCCMYTYYNVFTYNLEREMFFLCFGDFIRFSVGYFYLFILSFFIHLFIYWVSVINARFAPQVSKTLADRLALISVSVKGFIGTRLDLSPSCR